MKWQEELARNIDSAEELRAFFGQAPAPAFDAAVAGKYPMSITRYYLSLVNPADPNDPIARMCLPAAAELDGGGHEDTSGEFDNTVMTGLQHKYGQTALILSTSVCSLYCRYCFRKRMVGLTEDEVAADLAAVVDYVRGHPEIHNVLVSGGDAFLNTTDTIEAYLQALSAIDHLDYIRFGTKTPVVFPARILEDPSLQAVLRQYGRKKQLYVVTQFNHPRELAPDALRAVRRLRELGVVVRNQSVLLRGVNDDAATLAGLFSGLARAGIAPYYLFQCRPTRGANTFQVPLRRGADIVNTANRQLSGMGKCYRYVMSSKKGKLEILGNLDDGATLFRFHQAKSPAQQGLVFTRRLGEDDGWLEY